MRNFEEIKNELSENLKNNTNHEGIEFEDIPFLMYDADAKDYYWDDRRLKMIGHECICDASDEWETNLSEHYGCQCGADIDEN